jgi:hypothetical protein
MLPRLPPSSWAEVILLPQPPKQLRLEVYAIVLGRKDFNFKTRTPCQAWWCMPVFGRLIQKSEFEASLGYTVRSSLSLSLKEKEKKKRPH